MSLIMNESNFQHILRVLNTNLDGKVKVMFALTSIKGVGRRFSNIACKKAEVDLNKRCAAPPACLRRLPELAGALFCDPRMHVSQSSTTNIQNNAPRTGMAQP